jgi:hypothetical protein
MTVKELIEALEPYDDHMTIKLDEDVDLKSVTILHYVEDGEEVIWLSRY